jgi:hypothetical protein
MTKANAVIRKIRCELVRKLLWNQAIGRLILGVCVCVKVQFYINRNNGTAICSRLAGGGRGPSVDLDLVAVPFFVFGAKV